MQTTRRTRPKRAGPDSVTEGASVKLIKVVLSLVLPTLFLLPLLGCWHSNKAVQPSVPAPPGQSASLQQGAQAQHWFEEYLSAANIPAQDLSFQQKYDGEFLAPGMADPVDAAFFSLRQSLTASEVPQMQGWSFVEGACSTSGARILLVKQPVAGRNERPFVYRISPACFVVPRGCKSKVNKFTRQPCKVGCRSEDLHRAV